VKIRKIPASDGNRTPIPLSSNPWPSHISTQLSRIPTAIILLILMIVVIIILLDQVGSGHVIYVSYFSEASSRVKSLLSGQGQFYPALASYVWFINKS
jgi:hypothetical protein